MDSLLPVITYRFKKLKKFNQLDTQAFSSIISISVHNLSFKESLQQITEWGLKRQPGFICFANVHMAVEAYLDRAFQLALKKALLVLPDGKPLAVACGLLYKKHQERIAGMDFMPALLKQAGMVHGKIFLFGSTSEILAKLIKKIELNYPGTNVVGAISPPFRKLSEAETDNYIRQINESGAHFILIALGCPKQEKWMAEHFQKISGILLGVGGAFSVIAGVQKRCPHWMRDAGLEWVYRLIQEPRRLFKRYLITNSMFLYLLGRQMLQGTAHRREHLN